MGAKTKSAARRGRWVSLAGVATWAWRLRWWIGWVVSLEARESEGERSSPSPAASARFVARASQVDSPSPCKPCEGLARCQPQVSLVAARPLLHIPSSTEGQRVQSCVSSGREGFCLLPDELLEASRPPAHPMPFDPPCGTHQRRAQTSGAEERVSD